MPQIYNPPPEIFVERYTRLGDWVFEREGSGKHVGYIIGPSCNKVLARTKLIGKEPAVASRFCPTIFDSKKLDQVALRELPDLHNSEFKYFFLNNEEMLLSD